MVGEDFFILIQATVLGKFNHVLMINFELSESFINLWGNVSLIEFTVIQGFTAKIIKRGHVVQPAIWIISNVGELIQSINELGQSIITAVVREVLRQPGKGAVFITAIEIFSNSPPHLVFQQLLFGVIGQNAEIGVNP